MDTTNDTLSLAHTEPDHNTQSPKLVHALYRTFCSPSCIRPFGENVIPRELFADYLKEALANLYDPGLLQTHPLADLLDTQGAPQESRSQRLRQIVIEAIETLRPAATVPFGRSEWLGYRVMWLRYVECRSQAEICQELGLGRTSFYNWHRQAFDAVVSIMWAQYQAKNAAPSTKEPLPSRTPADVATEEAVRLASVSDRQPVDLGAVLEGAKEMIQPLAEHQGIELDIEAPSSLPSIYGDPAILRQILLNVLTEAVDLATNHQLRLSVSLSEGMTVWRLQNLARPVGMESSLVQLTGLAVSQGLLKVYGGRLWTEEDRSGAVTILFTVPVARQKTILIIDDSADALALYQRHLQGQDYILRVARNSEEEQAVLADATPDLILLDVLMPQQDGWDILQRLKTMPETASIPVVICSVLSQPQLGLVLGAAQVLQKPIDQRTLLQTVQALLAPADSAG